MEKESVKVSLIGKGENNFYKIKFPNLQIPVNVNEELYRKMLHSNQYEFKHRRPPRPERVDSYSSNNKMLSI